MTAPAPAPAPMLMRPAPPHPQLSRWPTAGTCGSCLRDAVERVLLRHAAQLREAARHTNEALNLNAQPAALPVQTSNVAAPSPRFCSAAAAKRRATVATLLATHRQYLATRAAEGCRNAMQVWRKLKAQGFTGGIASCATPSLNIVTPRDGGQLDVAAPAVRTMAVPSMRGACAWVLAWQQPKLEEPERSNRRRLVETLCRIEPSIPTARHLAVFKCR